MQQVNKHKGGVIFLFAITVLYLAITSFFLPFNPLKEEWIPLLGGFVNLDIIYSSKILMSLLGGIFIFLISFSNYLIILKLHNLSINKEYIVLFSLFLILLFGHGLYFSSIFVSSFFIPWLLYYLLNKKIFNAGFFLALASMFYMPIILTVPVLLLYVVIKSLEPLKGFLAAFFGVLLPYVYLLTFRYLFFNDCIEFIDECLYNLKPSFLNFFSINVPKIFIIICFTVIIAHSIIFINSKLNSFSKIKDSILRLSIFSLILYFFLYICYGGDKLYDLSILLVTPLSLILSDYFKVNNESYLSKGELILLLCAAIIYRTSFFII